MHLLTLIEPSSKAAATPHPQEDYAASSGKYPIYAVADGVTLEVAGEYPAHSGAAEAARIFCETAVQEAEQRYASFAESDLLEVFRVANAAVGEYNRSQGCVKESLDYMEKDLFAATAAFGLCKDGMLYWFSLCDSFVFLYDSAGAQKFSSPDPWDAMRPVWKAFSGLSVTERKILIRRDYRNGAEALGGYGVTTGESGAEKYLKCGSVSLADGDLLAICTDGFEPYARLPEFPRLLLAGHGAQERVQAFTQQKVSEDAERFGAERTLIAAICDEK